MAKRLTDNQVGIIEQIARLEGEQGFANHNGLAICRWLPSNWAVILHGMVKQGLIRHEEPVKENGFNDRWFVTDKVERDGSWWKRVE